MNMNMVEKLPVRTAEIQKADTKNPLFRLKFKDIRKGSGETQDLYAAITIDNNGSDDSKLIILLNIGVSATSYTQYQFSAAAAAVADPSAVDSSPTHAQVTTLGALIDAVNALRLNTTPVGLWMVRLDAAADYSIDTDDFIDLTEETMSPLFTDYLYRDASELTYMSMRLGNPDDLNGKRAGGEIDIVSIQALVDSNSGTDCEFKMSYDPEETDYTQEEELGYTRLVPDNSWTTLWDWSTRPLRVKGPILIELTSTVSMADGAKCLINYRNAEV